MLRRLEEEEEEAEETTTPLAILLPLLSQVTPRVLGKERKVRQSAMYLPMIKISPGFVDEYHPRPETEQLVGKDAVPQSHAFHQIRLILHCLLQGLRSVDMVLLLLLGRVALVALMALLMTIALLMAIILLLAIALLLTITLMLLLMVVMVTLLLLFVSIVLVVLHVIVVMAVVVAVILALFVVVQEEPSELLGVLRDPLLGAPEGSADPVPDPPEKPLVVGQYPRVLLPLIRGLPLRPAEPPSKLFPDLSQSFFPPLDRPPPQTVITVASPDPGGPSGPAHSEAVRLPEDDGDGVPRPDLAEGREHGYGLSPCRSKTSGQELDRVEVAKSDRSAAASESGKDSSGQRTGSLCTRRKQILKSFTNKFRLNLSRTFSAVLATFPNCGATPVAAAPAPAVPAPANVVAPTTPAMTAVVTTKGGAMSSIRSLGLAFSLMVTLRTVCLLKRLKSNVSLT